MKTSLFAAMLVATSTAALCQENLSPSHLVYMNPFLVQKYQQQAIDEGYVPPQIPAAVKEEAKFSYIAKHFDEFKYSPGVERLKQEISQKYALQKVQETAGTAPAFYATLSESELQALTESPEVVTIYPIDQKNDSFVFSLTNDYSSQGEIIPWAKQQVLADDNISSAVNFYIIDGYFNNANLGNEINLAYTNGGGDPGNPNSTPGGAPHASSVLSIAAAQRNWSKIRGINPGQPVVHYGIVLSQAQIHDSLATISSMAEWANQFSTLNFSINEPDGAPTNRFRHVQDWTRHETGIRATHDCSVRREFQHECL